MMTGPLHIGAILEGLRRDAWRTPRDFSPRRAREEDLRAEALADAADDQARAECAPPADATPSGSTPGCHDVVTTPGPGPGIP